MKTKDEYEVRDYHLRGGYASKGTFTDLSEAAKNAKYNQKQVTWEDLENKKQCPEYSVIFHYRDDEHYNDLYFIRTVTLPRKKRLIALDLETQTIHRVVMIDYDEKDLTKQVILESRHYGRTHQHRDKVELFLTNTKNV